MTKKTPTPPNFAQASTRLEQIIHLMDNPETSLEDMIALGEEGSTLIHQCQEILQNAQLRLEKLEAPAKPSAPPAQAEPEHDDFSLL